MMTTQPHDVPRYALGQQVKVIANNGGLYAAQIGVVGVISKRRQKRLGHRSYDVTYRDAKQREKRVIVREDDLEAVTESGASVTDFGASVTLTETLAEPMKAPEPSDTYHVGQRVTVHPAADGMEDEYPSFTHYPIVGEIVSACLVTADGAHCYDVRFPRIERGVSTESWPPVSIREAHLTSEPSQVGWMAHEAAMARRKASAKASAKAPEQPQPKFSVGEHVSVDPHSAICYETWTRKGAVGKIVAVNGPVRGIRRYNVRYESVRLGVKVSRIREEHLLPAETPAPREYTKARHAYEYREEKQRPGERLWCDAGGCFIEDCAVCRAYLGDTLSPSTAASATPASDKAVTVFACARGGGRPTCQHDWQTWGADSRYRLCRKCKAAERISVAPTP